MPARPALADIALHDVAAWGNAPLAATPPGAVRPLPVSPLAAPLARELLAMRDEELALRAELEAAGTLFDGYHPRLEQLQGDNARRMAAILDAAGRWPGISMVGDEAEAAAWLVVQHALPSPGLMRRGRDLLRDAVVAGDAPAVQLAMLEDRIRALEGRPQLFGTQFDWDDEGTLVPWPAVEAGDVDARRQRVGLGPLQEHIERMRANAGLVAEQPPADPARKRREEEDWARKVGWRGPTDGPDARRRSGGP